MKKIKKPGKNSIINRFFYFKKIIKLLETIFYTYKKLKKFLEINYKNKKKVKKFGFMPGFLYLRKT